MYFIVLEKGAPMQQIMSLIACLVSGERFGATGPEVATSHSKGVPQHCGVRTKTVETHNAAELFAVAALEKRFRGMTANVRMTFCVVAPSGTLHQK
jgi:hypothetical protein